MTAAFFDPRRQQTAWINLPGERIRRQVYLFPDRKVLIIGESPGDGREGGLVIHSNGLKELSEGETEHAYVGSLYTAIRMFEHMSKGGAEEHRLLSLRIDELTLCANYLRRCGKITNDQHKEIFDLLRDIERDLGTPKRNPEKLRAAQNVSTARNYRSPKGQNPVGPVAAMAARGAIQRIENRLKQLLGIRTYAELHHALMIAHALECETLFKQIKEAKSFGDLHEPVAYLECIRVNPFHHPARKIERAYAEHRYAELPERDMLEYVRAEAHGVLLIGVIEKSLIGRMSKILHGQLSETKVAELLEGTISISKKIETRIGECSAFTKDVRDLAVRRLRHARGVLSQEDLFTSPKRRTKSAKRVLGELTAVLPV